MLETLGGRVVAYDKSQAGFGPLVLVPTAIAVSPVRHQASLMRAPEPSVASSTVSSTSRQKAYNAVIARRRSGGKNRKL